VVPPAHTSPLSGSASLLAPRALSQRAQQRLAPSRCLQRARAAPQTLSACLRAAWHRSLSPLLWHRKPAAACHGTGRRATASEGKFAPAREGVRRKVCARGVRREVCARVRPGESTGIRRLRRIAAGAVGLARRQCGSGMMIRISTCKRRARARRRRPSPPHGRPPAS